jgi:hypothetical protein
MSDKIYKRLVALILALGMLTTGGLVAYTAYLRGHISIITYIAGEDY